MVRPVPQVTQKTTSIFLSARWQHLAMINYAIDPQVLAPLIPKGTELDLWEERCLVSLVGFRFLQTRVRGWTLPGHRDFDEINLRFYVRRQTSEGWRRGVVFVKEVVPRRLIAWVANALYHEHYAACPTRHAHVGHRPDGYRRTSYAWFDAGRWQHIGVLARGEKQPLEEDTEAHFIAEHYWGYVKRRDGRTGEYRVDHPTWSAWSGCIPQVELDGPRVYGSAFAEALSAPPVSAMLCDGSAVNVHAGTIF